MLPLCRDTGTAVVPWSPLARGRLTRDWDETAPVQRGTSSARRSMPKPPTPTGRWSKRWQQSLPQGAFRALKSRSPGCSRSRASLRRLSARPSSRILRMPSRRCRRNSRRTRSPRWRCPTCRTASWVSAKTSARSPAALSIVYEGGLEVRVLICDGGVIGSAIAYCLSRRAQAIVIMPVGRRSRPGSLALLPPGEGNDNLPSLLAERCDEWTPVETQEQIRGNQRCIDHRSDAANPDDLCPPFCRRS